MNKKNTKKNSAKGISRRSFIGKTAAATAAFTIVPRHVLGGPGFTAPSDMVNVAGIGLGNQGGSDIRNIATPDVAIKARRGLPGLKFYRYPGIRPPRSTRQMSANQMGEAGGPKTFKHANIYALCDVDTEYAGHIIAGYPKAKVYDDFRKMIDTEKDLDAVVIATPDHTHAVIASYAMKAGLNVFVEKP
ncbi:MAG: Gfo/Idh/MocA family oxidoreductase, partial [Bacteroidota bacterium]|nr:Gfo/Idh/MocA family oxidoreductase [Bacteroidota bacterium]